MKTSSTVTAVRSEMDQGVERIVIDVSFPDGTLPVLKICDSKALTKALVKLLKCRYEVRFNIILLR